MFYVAEGGSYFKVGHTYYDKTQILLSTQF